MDAKPDPLILRNGTPLQPPETDLPSAKGRSEQAKAVKSLLVDMRKADFEFPVLGQEAREGLAIAVAEMIDALNRLVGNKVGTTLSVCAEALEEVEADPEAVRKRRGPKDWLSGRPAPADALREQIGALSQKFETEVEQLGNDRDLREQAVNDLRRWYQVAIAAYNDHRVVISAGVARMDEIKQDLIPLQQKSTEELPENRGEEIEGMIDEMRNLRDGVERRMHTLRRDRYGVLETLPKVCDLAESEAALTRIVSGFLGGSLPDWLKAAAALGHGLAGRSAMADTLEEFQAATARTTESARAAVEMLERTAEARETSLSGLRVMLRAFPPEMLPHMKLDPVDEADEANGDHLAVEGDA